MDDVERYRGMLASVEAAARDQPWANERPWRVASHVTWEGRLPVVDLHDLRAALARDAVRAVLTRPPAVGALVFVHGRGRHTLGAGSVLRDVVKKELQHACAEVSAWSYRPHGSARWVWITDWKRAPAQVTGGSSVGWWIALVGFALLVAWAVGRQAGAW